MKWILALAAACLALPGIAEAGTKTYEVQAFDRIAVSAGIKLDVKVGPAQSVIAETKGDDFDNLLIEVRDGGLFIGRPPRWFWFGKGPNYRVKVSVPALHGLHASSGAYADVTGALSGDAMISASSSGRAEVAEVKGGLVGFHASSSGSLKVGALDSSSLNAHASSSGFVTVDELRSGNATIEASSSGGVEAAGTCEALSVSASSGGSVRAPDLKCESVQAHASSGGRIEAFASKSLAAHASSGGSVRVAGKPAQVQKEESSGGRVDVSQ